MACGVAILTPACRSASKTRLAAQAEQEGRHHLAYQHYCAEAKEYPSSRGVRSDIARVAPKAARYWQTEGDRAAGEGRYSDAWKLYMQALSITPDNTALASLIRNFEKDHPMDIAPAKDRWLFEGDRALASAVIADPPAPLPPKPSPKAEAKTPPESAGAQSTGTPSYARDTAPTPLPRLAEAKPTPAPPQKPVAASEVDVTPDAMVAPAPQRTRPAPSEGKYLLSSILSRKDPRFAEKSPVFDGLRIQLLSTDPDPDADFEVYLDDRRTKRLHNVAPGRGLIMRGRSGRWYELVVLTVVDNTESMRFAVRPYVR